MTARALRRIDLQVQCSEQIKTAGLLVPQDSNESSQTWSQSTKSASL